MKPKTLPRHDKGRTEFGHLLDAWIKASGLSALAWTRLAEASLGVPKLHTSQLSSMRNGLAQSVALFVFDALAAVNSERWKAEPGTKGRCKLTGELRKELMRVPPLQYEGEPADAADLALVYLGLQDSPVVPGWSGAPRLDASETSKAIGRTVRKVIADLKLDVVDGIQQLLVAYPTADQGRLNKVRLVALDLAEWSAEEADDEVVAICQALRTLTGEPWDLEKLLAESRTAVVP